MTTPVMIPPVAEFSRISSERISVVVQGPIVRDSPDDKPTTNMCLQSIARHLPQAEVVLSTWEGSDLEGIGPFDKLVTSVDPGGIWNYVKRRHNNVNRMIRSTSSGIAQASREYCLKFRTDLHLTSDAICRVDASEARDMPYTLFSVPVTTTSYYVRDPAVIPMAFHPSDIVQFGRTADLAEFWTQSLVDATQIMRPNGPIMSIFGRYAGFTPIRLVPEQVVTLQWLEKRGIHVGLTDMFDVSFEAFRIWEQVMLKNFRLIDAERSGVAFHARLRRKKFFAAAANFNESRFARVGLQQGALALRWRWLSAIFSKYVRCFIYYRYYRKLWNTHRLYREWNRQRAV
jgi:hypothetical protein